MEEIQKRIGYTFKNIRLLETALTHPSYAGDHHVESYQRLEFLGDAVLELCVSEALYKAHASLSGAKTRFRRPPNDSGLTRACAFRSAKEEAAEETKSPFCAM